MKLKNLMFAAAVTMMSASASAVTVVTPSTDANALASAIVGPGVTISNATLSPASPTAAGTFSGGASSIGFDSGVLLTTGTVNCAPGPNTSAGCTGPGATTSLKFDFVTTTGNMFVNYVFASEEYDEYVGSGFNDIFQLLLNGTNVALVPGGGGPVSINNVNNSSNSSFYVDNTPPFLNTQFDGLTKVLTVSASGLVGTNTFEFLISDVGDSAFDSGVFIQAGTFSGEPPSDVPEPASAALLGLGLLGFMASRRKSEKNRNV